MDAAAMSPQYASANNPSTHARSALLRRLVARGLFQDARQQRGCGSHVVSPWRWRAGSAVAAKQAGLAGRKVVSGPGKRPPTLPCERRVSVPRPCCDTTKWDGLQHVCDEVEVATGGGQAL